MTRWMRLFLRLLVFAALTAGGIWLGQQVMTDPGYVLFALGGYAIEMSFWIFLICLIVVIVSFWIVSGLLWRTGQLPVVLWRAFGSVRRDRADRRVAEGALWLQRGEPDRALQLLTKDSVNDSVPAVHWILAAIASAQLEDTVAADQYLSRAQSLMRDVPKPLLVAPLPTRFNELTRALNKQWNEDWVLLACRLDCEDPLVRLRDLQRFEKRHSASPMLALVQAKLARWAGLEAEATHYRSRAHKLAPDDPRILLEAVEAALGPHPALQELAAVLDA